MLTSSRDFKPIFDETDFGNVYRDLERVYLVTLSKDTENPLGPRSDEVGKKKDKEKPTIDKDKEGDKDKAKPEKKPGDEAKKDDKDKDPKAQEAGYRQGRPGRHSRSPGRARDSFGQLHEPPDGQRPDFLHAPHCGG